MPHTPYSYSTFLMQKTTYNPYRNRQAASNIR